MSLGVESGCVWSSSFFSLENLWRTFSQSLLPCTCPDPFSKDFQAKKNKSRFSNTIMMSYILDRNIDGKCVTGIIIRIFRVGIKIGFKWGHRQKVALHMKKKISLWIPRNKVIRLWLTPKLALLVTEFLDPKRSSLDILLENGDMDFFDSVSVVEFLLLTEGVVNADRPICFIPSANIWPEVSFFMWAVSLKKRFSVWMS